MRRTIDFKDMKCNKFDIGQLSFNIGVLLISSVLPDKYNIPSNFINNINFYKKD